MAGYWESRQHLRYYTELQAILADLGRWQSLLDIGPMDTPLATWGDFHLRYTIGPDERPALPGVTAIRGLWPDDRERLPSTFSVVACCQVIEHVANPQPMIDAIFAAARDLVILSVPYKWTAGACQYHVHDPIDEAKLLRLVGREPTRSEIVREMDDCARLIAVYEVANA